MNLRAHRPMCLAVALGLVSAPIRAEAQDAELRPRGDSVDVHFPRGATAVTVRTQVSDCVDRDYVLRARQGQTLTVRLYDDPHRLVAVSVIAPAPAGGDGWRRLSSDVGHGEAWSAQLPASGEYRVRVMGITPRFAVVRLVVGITDSPSREADSLAGHYDRQDDHGTLDLATLADGRLRFELEATWAHDEVIHDGTAEGVVTLRDGVGTYAYDECRLTFRATSDGIAVAQSGRDVDCGFGANVTASGIYVGRAQRDRASRVVAPRAPDRSPRHVGMPASQRRSDVRP